MTPDLPGRNGLITEQAKVCTVNDILFPKGKR